MCTGANLLAMFAAVSMMQAPPSDLERAEVRAREALVRYQAGELQEAARLFLEAYRLSGRPTPLRNAAKALEEAGRLEDALVHWSVYATLEAISTRDREEARLHVLSIRSRLSRRGGPAPVPPDPQPPTIIREPGRRPLPVGGWVLLGAGTAVAATGAVLWALAASDLSGLDDALGRTDPQGRTIGIDRAGAESDLDSINQRRTAGMVLVGVGAASLVAATVWLAVGAGSEEPATADNTPMLVPVEQGAVLLWSGRL